MFTYKQSTGQLTLNGQPFGKGYSGMQGVGYDNPAEQFVKDVGPIPEGFYTIEGPPFNTTEHGPFVMRLTPDAANDMEGRSGLLCHGDSVVHPGAASEGCVVMPRLVREAMWSSGDRRLQVIA
jgi:hypothetical protein